MDISNKKNQENIKENKKAVLPFIIVIIIALLLGVVIGAMTVFFSQKGLNEFYSYFYSYTGYIVPPILLAVSFICVLASLFIYFKSKKMYKRWDGKDETQIVKTEKFLSVGLILTNFATIFTYVNYAVSFSYIKMYFSGFPFFISVTVYLIVMMIYSMIMQQKYVNFVKLINPEKKGSVFDFKFNKQWEKSCDESEKLMIYKAGYKTYRITNIFCILLWLLLFITDQIFSTGVLPIIVISIVWLVSMASYSYYSLKIEFGKSKQGEQQDEIIS